MLYSFARMTDELIATMPGRPSASGPKMWVFLPPLDVTPGGITNFLENDGTLEAAQRIAGHAASPTTCSMTAAVISQLLFYSENCVLCHFGDSEFEHGFGRNPDLLLRLGIKARARPPLLFHQFAKAGQDEFTGLWVAL